MKTADQLCSQNKIYQRQTLKAGHNYTTCPECSHTRKRHNRKKKCLRVTVDQLGIKFTCFHCGWFGHGFYDEDEHGTRQNRRNELGRKQRSRRGAGRKAGAGGERQQDRVPVRVWRPDEIHEMAQHGQNRLEHTAERPADVSVQRGLPERLRGNAGRGANTTDHNRGRVRRDQLHTSGPIVRR